MKYFKYMKEGRVIFYQPEIQPEGITMCIPHAEDNTDYKKMISDPNLEMVEVQEEG